MEAGKQSLRIESIAWGKVYVEGFSKPFKDVKLFPGGAREWDWNETGTQHIPGIQPADVLELIEHGASTIVLSKGMLERLQICPETLALLQEKAIRVKVAQTEVAMKLYNDLCQEETVGALIHSTC